MFIFNDVCLRHITDVQRASREFEQSKRPRAGSLVNRVLSGGKLRGLAMVAALAAVSAVFGAAPAFAQDCISGNASLTTTCAANIAGSTTQTLGVIIGTNAVGSNATGGPLDIQAVAIGDRSVSDGGISVAVGAVATAHGDGVAIGEQATSNGVGVAIGHLATSTGALGSTAVGESAVATGSGATSLGQDAGAFGNGAFSTSVGGLATGSGFQSTSVGHVSTASGANSSAFGQQAHATGDSSTALGQLAVASGASSSALGEAANAAGVSSTALGQAATASADSSTALGQSSLANATSAMALGHNSQATALEATAVGESAIASGAHSFAGADDAVASGANSFAGGTNSAASGASSVALGDTAQATQAGAVAIGHGAVASGDPSTAVGTAAMATGTNSTALGFGATAANNNASAIGNGATTTRDNQIVLGTTTNTYTTPGITSAASLAAQTVGPIDLVTSDQAGNLAVAPFTALTPCSEPGVAGALQCGTGAVAGGTQSTALGQSSTASGTGSTAIGFGASATAPNSVALGAGSVASDPNTVSVGSPGNERRITNVAAGINPTDAVNVSQLNSLSANFQSQIGGLQNQIAINQTEMRRGIALAVAANGYTTPIHPGGTTVGMSGGFFAGSSAVGISVAHRVYALPSLVLYGSYANSDGAENIYKVGASYEF